MDTKDHITDFEHDKDGIAITTTKPAPLGEAQTNRISLISFLKDVGQRICRFFSPLHIASYVCACGIEM